MLIIFEKGNDDMEDDEPCDDDDDDHDDDENQGEIFFCKCNVSWGGVQSTGPDAATVDVAVAADVADADADDDDGADADDGGKVVVMKIMINQDDDVGVMKMTMKYCIFTH